MIQGNHILKQESEAFNRAHEWGDIAGGNDGLGDLMTGHRGGKMQSFVDLPYEWREKRDLNYNPFGHVERLS